MGNISIGENSLESRSELVSRLEARMESEGVTADDRYYIKKLDFSLFKGEEASVTDEDLERLRSVCQHWDVSIKPMSFSSHRKFIGPIIVGVKRALFPIFRLFLKDFIREQRLFNAEVVKYLAALSKKERRSE